GRTVGALAGAAEVIGPDGDGRRAAGDSAAGDCTIGGWDVGGCAIGDWAVGGSAIGDRRRSPVSGGRPGAAEGSWSVRRRPAPGGGPPLGRAGGRRSMGSSPAGRSPSRRRSARLDRGMVIAPSVSGSADGPPAVAGALAERGSSASLRRSRTERSASSAALRRSSARRRPPGADTSGWLPSLPGATCLPTVREASRARGLCPGPDRSVAAGERLACGAAGARAPGRPRGPRDGPPGH
ncbi:MAG: hypothetical protein JWR66_3571, partial [Modestobacter sp.]|nr:hypothetical protein [Modestobacter sp.]